MLKSTRDGATRTADGRRRGKAGAPAFLSLLLVALLALAAPARAAFDDAGAHRVALGLFQPTGVAPLSVTNVSARVAFGTSQASTPNASTALITNTGSVDAFINFGDVTVTAATSGVLVRAGERRAFNIGANTYVASITAASTTTLSIETGPGVPVIAGGTVKIVDSAGTNVAAVDASGRQAVNLGAVGGSAMALGQTTMSASVPVTVASNQGAVPASQSGTWTVQPGNTANSTAWLVQAVAGTTGGASITSTQVANNTTAVSIKASAGVLYGVGWSNNSATVAYIKLFNATSATCGSGTPVLRFMIPASSTSFLPFADVGVAFGTGIQQCVTTDFADNAATAPAASTYVVNVVFK